MATDNKKLISRIKKHLKSVRNKIRLLVTTHNMLCKHLRHPDSELLPPGIDVDEYAWDCPTQATEIPGAPSDLDKLRALMNMLSYEKQVQLLEQWLLIKKTERELREVVQDCEALVAFCQRAADVLIAATQARIATTMPAADTLAPGHYIVHPLAASQDSRLLSGFCGIRQNRVDFLRWCAVRAANVLSKISVHAEMVVPVGEAATVTPGASSISTAPGSQTLPPKPAALDTACGIPAALQDDGASTNDDGSDADLSD